MQRPRALSADGIGGSGTANHIAKFTDPTTIGDSVIYESAGNVGIGTVNPQGGFDLHSGESETDALFVRASPDIDGHGGIILHQSRDHAWQAIPHATVNPVGGSLRFHYVYRAEPATRLQENVL